MNNCNICQEKIVLFQPKTKCWERGCNIMYHNKCLENENKFEQCKKCFAFFCNTHINKHNCTEINSEEVIEEKVNFEEIIEEKIPEIITNNILLNAEQEKERQFIINDYKKILENHIVFSNNKKIAILSVSQYSLKSEANCIEYLEELKYKFDKELSTENILIFKKGDLNE